MAAFTGQPGVPQAEGGFLQPAAVATISGTVTPPSGGTSGTFVSIPANSLQWVAVNLLTGLIVCDLPDVELTAPLAVTIGQFESTSVNLHLTSSTNPDWIAGTQPGGAALIAWVGDPTAPTIVWGGIVQQRVRTMEPVVTLALVTAEAYLDACYVGAYTATGLNQDTIVASLMAFAAGPGRVPFSMNHLTASTAVQTVAYTTSSQTTVYAALQALSGVTGGPEWTMDWVWNLSAGTIFPRMNYGARVGHPVNAGAMPNVTVELADMLNGSAFTEDYSPGHGANDVIAYGSASATATTSDVPSAEATALNTKGRPLWTYVYQPNQTVSDPATLATYATAAVTQLSDGALPLTLVLPNTLPGKQFGQDWALGDDIGWSLAGTAFPAPISGVGRCISYRADVTTITPILKGASLG